MPYYIFPIFFCMAELTFDHLFITRGLVTLYVLKFAIFFTMLTFYALFVDLILVFRMFDEEWDYSAERAFIFPVLLFTLLLENDMAFIAYKFGASFLATLQGLFWQAKANVAAELVFELHCKNKYKLQIHKVICPQVRMIVDSQIIQSHTNHFTTSRHLLFETAMLKRIILLLAQTSNGQSARVDQGFDLLLKLRFGDKLVLFYYSYNSMKYQKSSFSLHSTSPSVFREKSQNILFPASKFQNKRQTSYSKDFASIYNARGRLKYCSEVHSQLQQLSETINLTNKDLKLELSFMKEQITQKLLRQVEGELSMEIKELRKQITIKKRSDLLRYESITQILGSMQKNHKQVKKKVEELEARVTNLQNVMGVGCPLSTLV